jgi:dTDP-4-dehydrorhamnose 3,5-epimerase
MAFTFTKNEVINDIILIDTKSFWDQRWFFMETYNQKDFEANWITTKFVQDNYSKSIKGVFRWFHFQTQHTQAKLVRVNIWSVLDFAIDIRKDSPTYGRYIYELLSAKNKKQLFIPKWFAHGFLVLEDETEFYYKCDDYYDPEHEGGIYYTDKEIQINREEIMKNHDIKELILAEKDKKHPTLKEFYINNPF